VNSTRLPEAVTGLHGVTVPIKDAAGELLESAIPKVSILKDGSYYEDETLAGPEQQVDIVALLDYSLRHAPLAGFAVEGLSPYGKPASPSRTRALLRAIYSGLPVVQCGRGNTEGFAIPMRPFIAGAKLLDSVRPAPVAAASSTSALPMRRRTAPRAVSRSRPTDRRTRPYGNGRCRDKRR